MEEAAQLYNLKGKILLADREYTGKLWFTFLHQQGIDFVIRLQRECYKHDTLTSYPTLERKAMRRKRPVWTWLNWADCRLKLVMCRNEDPRPPKDPRKRAEPVFYWLTSLDNPQAVPAHYRKRWRIEQCFKALKTNGFHLESMNFKQSAKIELLLAVVVFAYVLSVKAGEAVSDQIRTKTYQNATSSPAQSLFKKGLEVLNATLLVFEQFVDYLLGVFKLAKPRRFCFVQ